MSKASESDQTVVAIDDVVKALSRLGTLTWQHRQMIKDGDVLSLLEQFVAGQRSAEWMYICGVVAFGAHFLFGVLAGQLNWISAVISMILVVELRRQRSTIRDVTVVVRQFADSLGYEVPTREAQLLTELRSQYTLTYQQNH